MSMMGELTFFLGLQIKQSPKGIFISQTTYTKELIKKFGMENAKSIGTPMILTTTLEEDNNGKSMVETMYRVMIGSSLYLTASHPDIMFSVCKYARFRSAPKESHLTAVKCIIRYLIGTTKLGLCAEKEKEVSRKSEKLANILERLGSLKKTNKAELTTNFFALSRLLPLHQKSTLG
ncbi:uncharacterized mitochondrial protein AtMg00810-like [Nicotiana tomentosiformis]|uniref:uncharacterized mitochondrial protein AtMg00810-like n=1 Tax=Nicotiana tomentosiformis TaxID=4098 RepID=UPI00388CD907